MEQKTSYADKLVDIRSVSVNKELPREESLLCVLLIVRTELH